MDDTGVEIEGFLFEWLRILILWGVVQSEINFKYHISSIFGYQASELYNQTRSFNQYGFYPFFFSGLTTFGTGAPQPGPQPISYRQSLTTE